MFVKIKGDHIHGNEYQHLEHRKNSRQQTCKARDNNVHILFEEAKKKNPFVKQVEENDYGQSLSKNKHHV